MSWCQNKMSLRGVDVGDDEAICTKVERLLHPDKAGIRND
jgi:hypothetical protein